MAEEDPLAQEIEASIRGEEESRLAYAALARRATRDETRLLAERLSKEEGVHRDLLLRQFASHVDAANALAGIDFENLTAKILSDGTTPAELLDRAIEKERESESRYKFLAERHAKTPHWVLFLQLAEQEREHKSRLQRELDSLGGGLTIW